MELSEEFIERHRDEVDWNAVSEHQELSEKFIEKFKDRVNWEAISIYQRLSEEFIERHADRVDWFHILNSQKHLSSEFRKKHAWRIAPPLNKKRSVKNDSLGGQL